MSAPEKKVRLHPGRSWETPDTDHLLDYPQLYRAGNAVYLAGPDDKVATATDEANALWLARVVNRAPVVERELARLVSEAMALMPLGTKARADWLKRASTVVRGEHWPAPGTVAALADAEAGRVETFGSVRALMTDLRDDAMAAEAEASADLAGWEANGSPTEGE